MEERRGQILLLGAVVREEFFGVLEAWIRFMAGGMWSGREERCRFARVLRCALLASRAQRRLGWCVVGCGGTGGSSTEVFTFILRIVLVIVVFILELIQLVEPLVQLLDELAFGLQVVFLRLAARPDLDGRRVMFDSEQ